MEPFQIIVGTGALLAFILPIVYLRWLEHVKNRDLIARFLTLANQNGLSISKYDYWNICYCIGLDEKSQKILYFKMKDGLEKVTVVDLSTLQKCIPLNQSKLMKTHSGTSKVVESLGITLNFGLAKPEVHIEFYNGKESISLSGEIGLLDKWVNLINKSVGKPTKAIA